MIRLQRLFIIIVGFLGFRLIWNKLTNSPEERLLTNTEYDESSSEGMLPPELNVAVFGTGSANGQFLNNRFKEAFPYLLSAKVDNYAHQNQNNLNYFSTCLETAIGDDKIYHVIVADFYLHHHLGFDGLIRKLRSRFPHAMIILLKSWSPSHFRRKVNRLSTRSKSFMQWKATVGLNESSTVEEINKQLELDHGFWYYPNRPHADAAIDGITENYRAHVFKFPFLPEGPKATLLRFMNLFETKKHSNLGKLGHRAVANDLKHVIRNGHQNPQLLVDLATVGTFGGGDYCELWYSSGTARMRHSEALKMKQLDVTNYYVMELKGSDVWMNVTNPFEDPRTLYLSFITSNERNYLPNVLVEWGDGQSKEIVSLSTDPKLRETKTATVGRIPPGTQTIVLSPLRIDEEASLPDRPFGLIGYSFTDEVAVPLEYGFGLSFDRDEQAEQEERQESVQEEGTNTINEGIS